MAPTTHMQAAGVLLIGLEKRSSPAVTEAIAAEAGYNSSPLFGAKKARIRLMGEVVTVNAALTIVAVNQVFAMADAKTIIDIFLAGARQSLFAPPAAERVLQGSWPAQSRSRGLVLLSPQSRPRPAEESASAN